MNKKIMQKGLSLWLSVILIFSVMPLAVSNAIAEKGDYFNDGALDYTITSDIHNTVEIAGAYDLTVSNFEIPATVKYDGTTYNVTSIGSMAFVVCENLVSVKIRNGITSIGDYAFEFCPNLTSATIYNVSATIGENAFGYYNDKKVENFILYGYKGSTTEDYANKHGLKFQSISEKQTTPEVKKQSPKITVKTTAKKFKVKKLKKKSQSFNIGARVNSKGKLTYKKVSGNKKITINKKGKITIKKGLKKGNYKVKIKISAGAKGQYIAGSTTVTIRTTVK